jgi:ADP-ribosylglycohydrolase
MLGMRGGDADTNAAICDALLGAVHKIDNLPERCLRPCSADQIAETRRFDNRVPNAIGQLMHYHWLKR